MGLAMWQIQDVFWQHCKSLVDLGNEGGIMGGNAKYWVLLEKKTLTRTTRMMTMTTTTMMMMVMNNITAIQTAKLGMDDTTI